MNKKILRSVKEMSATLLTLMSRKDYDSITISEICTSAGYSRGTFYQNFYDKDDLLNRIIDEKINEMMIVFKGTNKKFKETSTEQADIEILSTQFKFTQDNSDFFKTVLKDSKIIGFRTKLYLAQREHMKNFLHNPFTDDLVANQANDDFYTMYVTSASLGLIIYSVNQGIDKSPFYIAEQFILITKIRNHDLLLGKQEFLKIREKNKATELDPRVLRTKQALKDALIRLLKQKQYESIQVSDITSLADYNRSTFYSHYRDKYELYQDIVSDFINGMISAVSDSESRNQANGEISSPLLSLFSFVYDNSTLLEIMYSDNKVPGFFNNLYTNFTNVLYQELDGRIKVDTEIYCHYITSALMAVVSLWVSTNRRYSPVYMTELMTKILQHTPVLRQY